MATQFGYKHAKELVENHGWKWDESPLPNDYIGDRRVIDPITGHSRSPHDAKAIQEARDKDKRTSGGTETVRPVPGTEPN